MKQLAYKFRIYPNKEQEVYFDKAFRTSNFIYNYFLNEQQYIDNMLKMYGLELKKDKNSFKRENKLYFDAYESSKELTKMGNSTHKFLLEVDSTIRSYVLDDLKEAFTGISRKGNGYPKYKNYNKNKSFTGQIRYSIDKQKKVKAFKLKENNKSYYSINIPKLKDLKCVIHREEFLHYWDKIEYFKLNSYTINKTPNNEYYISIQVENKQFTQPVIKEIAYDSTLGIDMGVERPITTSDKNDFNNPLFNERFNLIKNNEKEMKRLQQIISNKMLRNKDYKNSNKYHRIRHKINNLYDKIKKQREYFQHNITSQLVNKENVNCYILEDLSTKNMTKRAKNKNVKQKSALNKAILDIGFFGLYHKLKYKANSIGKTVEKVDPKYTSLTCSKCSCSDKNNRLTQSKFKCVNCGHEDNADFNASVNIKNKYFNKFALIKNNE